MNYTELSLAEIRTGILDVARDARGTFGALGERELNWQPDPGRWSIAQCFDHLVRGNDMLLASAKGAIDHPPTSLWQRIPLLPSLLGRALIRSQSPNAGGKYKAPATARPAMSGIPGDIIERFIAQHEAAEAWTRTLDEGSASRAIMVSPFIKIVTYSVLDGLRLLVAHDRRHFEQARRVMISRFL
jgi:hypothetical protein